MESPDAAHIELDATLDVYPELDDGHWQPPSILDVPPLPPTPTPNAANVGATSPGTGTSDPTLRAVLAAIAEKRRGHIVGKRPRHAADYNGLVSGTAGQRMIMEVDSDNVSSTGLDNPDPEALLDEEDISQAFDEVLERLTAQELERQFSRIRDASQDQNALMDMDMDVDDRPLEFKFSPDDDPPTAGLRLRLEFEEPPADPWVPEDSDSESQSRFAPRIRLKNPPPPSPPPPRAPSPPAPPPFDDTAARLSRCPCSRCSPNEERNARYADETELSAHAHAHAEQQDEIHRLFSLSPFAAA
ncbi:hypothetical protein HMN09_01183500 [Mycena chlorophos]|uniref:Uncharacterized protein n=1 Tax=Mycena chlorophos TaxID=658473 RepID=A0A8H6VZI5_MYCCL|nr:hypothetical protein HMN09_01183500 [Mycena chlorophos]